MKTDNLQQIQIKRYYRLHASIYNLSRWSFLFGRKKLIANLAKLDIPIDNILEVGCGTGKNIIELCQHFPQANITGIDISEHMLLKAHKAVKTNPRVKLLHQSYNTPLQRNSYDLVLFSYALSMFNPGWKAALTCAWEDLNPQGIFAIVDFHCSRYHWFKTWMRKNHVRMDGHLLRQVTTQYHPLCIKVQSAYMGVWKYCIFVGQK